MPFGIIWSHLDPSGYIWRHLELPGATWSNLESSEGIWNHVEPSGAMWSHVESFGLIWNHVEPSEATINSDCQNSPRAQIYRKLEQNLLYKLLPGQPQRADLLQIVTTSALEAIARMAREG